MLIVQVGKYSLTGWGEPMTKYNGRSQLLAACMLAVLSVAAVRAAEPDPGALGEIVVTAQKTTELMSKVPISISAVSGPALEEHHITGSFGVASFPAQPGSTWTTCQSIS